MTLLITGAEGFTGRYVADAARAAGRMVHALQADLTDAGSLQREVASVQPSEVLHLAGISYVGHADPRAFYDVNVFGSMNLLAALAALPRPPRCVVLASSANVYGNSPVSPIDESQPAAPTNHYAMSKLAMEYMSATHAQHLPIVITRPFNYTGPGQSPSFIIPKLVDHFARRAPVVELGNLDVEREFNDVRFVADLYMRLLDAAPAAQTYNLCSGQPVSLRAVLDLLGRMTNHWPEIRVNPAFVRPNEVRSLCGNPAKLSAVVGPNGSPSLEATLAWMLNASRT